MDEREFFEFCYDQYKHEHDEVNAIYQRAGVVLPTQIALGAAIVALGREDLMGKILEDPWVLWYYVCCGGALLALAISVFFLIVSIWPRSYANVASMCEWRAYVKSMSEYVAGRGKGTPRSDVRQSLEKALAEAQTKNALKNQARRRQFQVSVVACGFGAILLGCEAVFWLVLKVPGVKP